MYSKSGCSSLLDDSTKSVECCWRCEARWCDVMWCDPRFTRCTFCAGVKTRGAMPSVRHVMTLRLWILRRRSANGERRRFEVVGIRRRVIYRAPSLSGNFDESNSVVGGCEGTRERPTGRSKGGRRSRATERKGERETRRKRQEARGKRRARLRLCSTAGW